MRTSVIRTRNPGRRAGRGGARRGSEVVYLDTVHAPAVRAARSGPTATYLLSERPCRIVIETAGPIHEASRNGHSANGAAAGNGARAPALH